MMIAQRDLLIAFAAKQRVPAIYSERQAVIAGGLMSYGSSITDMYRQAGAYVGGVV